MTNNKTIATTNKNTTLTAQGNVTLVTMGNNTNVIQLTNGGSVILPADPCVQNPGQCVSGFTLTVQLNLFNISNDKVFIATSTGGNPTLPGLTLTYNRIKHKVTFQVVTSTYAWTADATFTWQQGAWHNVTVTFSPSAGVSLVIDGLLLGGATGTQTAPHVPKAPIRLTASSTAPSTRRPTTVTTTAFATSTGQSTSSNVNSGPITPTTMHQSTPTTQSLISGQALCLGCTPGSVASNGTTSTTTILVMSVLTIHLHINDLQKAGITTVKHPNKSKVTCHSSKLDFNFLNMTASKTKVVTSLGTHRSHGDVTVEQDGHNVLLVLDTQGEYVEVSNTGNPCVDDITACANNLTYRLVFRFLDFHIEPNFLFSSGGDLLNSTGISLYYFHGKLNFWVKDGVWVWRSIYDVTLDLDRWYTVDASWNHVTGIQLSLDGFVLAKELNSTHKAQNVTEKHPLYIARSPSDDKNMTSIMEILMFRVWTKSIDELKSLGCTNDLKIKNPVDRCKSNMTEVKFEEILRGQDLVTSLGTMKINGNVSVERTLFQQGQMVLVLDQGGYVDMGLTGITCLDDVASCAGSFNFRITFLLREISMIPNYIITSGGELLESTGVSLYYHNGQLRFWVKRGLKTDRKIVDHPLSVNVWYTLDASWDATDGSIKLFVDGTEVSGMQLFSTPTPPTNLTYPVHIGKSPGKNGTTKMNVLLFRFWEKTRMQLVTQGCTKTLAVQNPPDPPVTTSTVAPTTTSSNHRVTTTPGPNITLIPATVQTKFTFKQITNRTLVTTYTNMTIHGSVSLQYVPAGQILVLDKPGSYVDVGKTGIPCLDNVTSCSTGFNFRLVFTLTSTTTKSQVLISNGADKDAQAGVAVLYVNNSLVVHIKRPTDTLVGTFPCTLTPGFWFTVDVSWKAQGSLNVHLNNILLPELQLPKLDNYNLTTTPSPTTIEQQTSSITSTSAATTTQMMTTTPTVTTTAFPTTTSVNTTALPTTTAPITTTTIPTTTTTTTTEPTTTTLPTPGDCIVQDLDPQDKLFYNLTFLRLSQPDKLLVTPDGVLRAFGDPQLNSRVDTLGKALTFNGKDDAAELECIPCVSNLLNCMTGFTLQVDVALKRRPAAIDPVIDTVKLNWDAMLWPDFSNVQEDLEDNADEGRRTRRSAQENNTNEHVFVKDRAVTDKIVYILDSIEDPTRDMGMELFYFSNKIHVTLQADKSKWNIEAPYTLNPEIVYRIQISWDPSGPLKLYVDGFFVSEANRLSLPRVNYYQPRPLLLGRERNGQQNNIITLSELLIWMLTRDRLQQNGVVAALSTTPTTTTQTTTPGLVKDFVWTLVNIKQRVLVSHEWELVILGGPSTDKTGVILNTPDKFIRIPSIKDTCLTDPSVCTDGLTIEIVVKLTTLEENSIIFTSGGEVPDQPGITLIYRFGQVHIIVSTKLQSWYVSFSKTIIWTNDFCKVQVSWSQLTSLKVFVNEMLMGVSVTPVDHRNPTVSVTDALTIGGGRTTCIVNMVHIWLVHIDILIDLNIVKPQDACFATPSTQSTTIKAAERTTVKDTSIATKTPTLLTTMPLTAKTTKAISTPTAAFTATASRTKPAPTTKPTIQNVKTTSTASKPSTAPSTANPTQTPITTAKPATTLTTTAKSTTTPTTTTKPTTTPTATAKPTTTPTTTAKPTTTPITTAKPTTAKPTTTPTTTTTLPPCPKAPSAVRLEPQVDINGEGQLVCFLSTPVDPGMEIKFTFHIQGERKTWTNTIESPDVATTLPSATMGRNLINKKCPPMRPNGVVTVVEGRDHHVLQVKTTVPPAFFCKQADGGKCSVEVLTQIKQERGELRCSRREVIPQLVLGTSVIGNGGDKKCGVKINDKNWKGGVSIPVKATVDGVVDRNRVRKVKVSVRIVGQVTMDVQTVQCGEISFKAVDRDKKAFCASVNDPHITTFDKLTCDNRANRGRGRHSRVSIQVFKNGQLTPGTVIKRLGCGQKYEVTLPTGTKVVITGSKRPFMNIHVHASASDFDNVQGLCGNFNDARNDDLDGESSRTANDFSIKWK
ncbi:von Willebrand factor D and EGF domain-containing protein [Elysia marginata]|uniref:von Willebrand factor D and EGF domain-containing protein n=1 Tax=Elysia marginata TaxID=1093978 RepID=A0AAV4JN82_9GAST|nr:von Willebrand factor D and EGF domain-containing protein [Elysia marginata]